jgi:hypothetical protein
MRTVDIPGGTATLREKDDIKVRQRQLVESRIVAAASALEKLPNEIDELAAFDITKSNLTAAEADSIFDLQNATIVAALASWSLSDPIPTMDTVGDLDQNLYDALSTATAGVASEVTQPESFEPSDPRAPGFGATPTVPSAGSAAVSRADQEPQSTVAPLAGTPSTASAVSSPA